MTRIRCRNDAHERQHGLLAFFIPNGKTEDCCLMQKPKLSLKGRALRYLSQREHSRLELARKLSPHVAEGEDLDAVLDWLRDANFLSAERFSESLVHRRAARFGNHRILAELQSHQLSAEDMENRKAEMQETELVRAVNLLHRKFPVAPVDQEEKYKQMRFLQQRGFSSSSIRAAMQAERED